MNFDFTIIHPPNLTSCDLISDVNRSDLRQTLLQASRVVYNDIYRLDITKWKLCWFFNGDMLLLCRNCVHVSIVHFAICCRKQLLYHITVNYLEKYEIEIL